MLCLWAISESCIAIYKQISNTPENPPDDEDYQFTVGVYSYVLTKEWRVVANRPFDDLESAWPPPMKVVDTVTGKIQKYHKGEFWDVTPEESKSLETAAVWDGNQIIDRIMGDDRWHKYK